MRKQDDDLKIDITDIFGGEVAAPPPKAQAAPGAIPSASPSAAAPAEAPVESESQFQEWISARNQELEMKARELERRLQEINSQQNLEASSPQEVITETVETVEVPAPSPAPSPEPPPTAPSPPDSPIDFNAPIAPPFMGAAPAPGQAPPAPAAAEAPPPPDPQKVEELRKLQAEYEFLMLYDEYRNIIIHELKDLVGEKKTFTMLERTVEMARGKYPEIFRNANWDSAGNLLEDGSVDSQRLIENKNALDPQKADVVVDTALSTLLNLRLQAVEKGLGTGLRNKIRAHMYQWISEKIQKAGRDKKDDASLKRLSSYLL